MKRLGAAAICMILLSCSNEPELEVTQLTPGIQYRGALEITELGTRADPLETFVGEVVEADLRIRLVRTDDTVPQSDDSFDPSHMICGELIDVDVVGQNAWVAVSEPDSDEWLVIMTEPRSTDIDDVLSGAPPPSSGLITALDLAAGARVGSDAMSVLDCSADEAIRDARAAGFDV